MRHSDGYWAFPLGCYANFAYLASPSDGGPARRIRLRAMRHWRFRSDRGGVAVQQSENYSKRLHVPAMAVAREGTGPRRAAAGGDIDRDRCRQTP